MGNRAVKFQHEDFYIHEERPGVRKTIIRQDRYNVDDNENCVLVVGNKYYSVLNFSAFGLAIESDEVWVNTEVLRDTSLAYGGIEVGRLNLKMVRNEPLPEGGYLVAFEIYGEPLEVNVIETMKQVFTFTREQVKQLERESKIPSEIKSHIYDFKDFLTTIRDQVNEIEENLPRGDRQVYEMMERAVAEVVVEHMNNVFENQYHAFNEKLENLDPEVKEFAMNLDPRYCVQEEKGEVWGKWILRKAYEYVLPPEVRWRDKNPIEVGSGTTILPKFMAKKISESEFVSKNGDWLVH